MDDAKFQERLNLVRKKTTDRFTKIQLYRIVEKIAQVEEVGYDGVAVIRFGILDTYPELIKRYPDVFEGY